MASVPSPAPARERLRRERTIATGLLTASILVWVAENVLTIAGVAYMPWRFSLILIWYVCLFGPLILITWRHRRNDFRIWRIALFVVSLLAAASLLDLPPIVAQLRQAFPPADNRFIQGVQHCLIGSAFGLMLFGLVLSTLKAAEQIEVAKENLAAARAASRVKSDFLANMSHEIRTPLSAILGFSEALGERLAQPKQREQIEIIQRNGEHLLRLINDVLDLSKIEAGMLGVARDDCSPIALLREIDATMRPLAEAKGLQWSIHLDGPVPTVIHSDEQRIRQVLINLTGNAIKFTEHGTVALSVRCSAAGPSPRLEWEIADTGAGMTPTQAEQVFDPFTQADESITRRYGGTGLGLSISKRLVELLGGEIRVRSVLGEGSVFSFTIDPGPTHGVEMCDDLASAPPAIPAPANPMRPERLLKETRILVVEDGLDNQRLIVHLLNQFGAETVVAGNGRQGLERAAAADREGRPFDAILMDMQMPVMDGYVATQSLRASDYSGRIIALTAQALDGDREKCLQAGCDAYASKPIRRQDLFELIAGG